MRMLTVSLLVCAMMALTRADGDDGDASNNSTLSTGQGVNVSVLIQVPNARTVCSPGWSKYESRCFYHETTKRSWAQAELHCNAMIANLASIHSADEYNHIQQMTSEVVWIGGSDCQEGNAWFWIDGTPMDFNFWCPSQPDNTEEECCLQMNTGDGQCWDDKACNSLHPSICVKPL